jgi:uncharacterized protein (TIGR03435 family)
MFNFPLEFAATSAPADAPPEPSSDSAPDIFVALQEQIGLKLSPARGTLGFLIVDRVEKPSPN